MAALKRRRCKNCDQPFTQAREWQEFHDESCRKEFHRHGGVSITRLLDSPKFQSEVKRRVAEAVKRELAALRKLDVEGKPE